MLRLMFYLSGLSTHLEHDMTRFVNDCILDMFDYFDDLRDEDDQESSFYVSLFPHRLYIKNPEKCKETVYELKTILVSDYYFDTLTPLQSYVLFKVLDTWEAFYHDSPDIFRFELPKELKDRMLKDFPLEIDGETESSIIIESLESPDYYVDLCFDDLDFLENDLQRLLIQEVAEAPLLASELINFDAMDQHVDLMTDDVAEQYKMLKKGIEKENVIDPEKVITDTILYALNLFHKRVADFSDRGEVELTADLDNMIEGTLAQHYQIYTKREYNMGRALKALGETDLYFCKIEDGRLIDIAILENKDINRFTDQYYQLMGYLNPFFQFGITLSINRKYSLADARDKIISALLAVEGEYAADPEDIKEEAANHIVSTHIVPETGQKMRVHHLILNLADESRINAARKARRQKADASEDL